MATFYGDGYAVGMNKMIYVRKSDEGFWERLEEIAKRQGVGFSQYLSGLVRAHVYATGAHEAPAASLDELDATMKRAQQMLDELRAEEGS